jgi:hypothetical protein
MSYEPVARPVGSSSGAVRVRVGFGFAICAAALRASFGQPCATHRVCGDSTPIGIGRARDPPMPSSASPYEYGPKMCPLSRAMGAGRLAAGAHDCRVAGQVRQVVGCAVDAGAVHVAGHTLLGRSVFERSDDAPTHQRASYDLTSVQAVHFEEAYLHGLVEMSWLAGSIRPQPQQNHPHYYGGRPGTAATRVRRTY